MVLKMLQNKLRVQVRQVRGPCSVHDKLPSKCTLCKSCFQMLFAEIRTLVYWFRFCASGSVKLAEQV